MILDSHQHFWRYRAAEYPWIPAGSALQRDWMPEDLAQLQRPLGIGGSIAVQARQSLEETQDLLDLAAADPGIRGVVGWVDLRAPDLDRTLERLAENPRLVGLRHVAQDEPDDDFLARPDLIAGVRRAAAFGLTYDILIYERQLPAAIRLVQACPEQTFILDHLGKPAIRTGALSPWREQLRELARFPKVFCKTSGLVTEADPKTWTRADLRPYLDAALEAFGPSRLMFGSDWPVCLLAARYDEVWALAGDFAEQLPAEARPGYLGETAAQAYGIRE